MVSDHISNEKLHELGVKQCPGCFKPQQVTTADEVKRAAEDAYRETLTELRLNERGPFKSGSHHRRALHAALEAAAPSLLAELRKAQEALGRVEKVRQELFDVSNDEDFRPQARAAYRDASRAIYTALLEAE